jgi:putative NADH-flavin reductase
MRVAVVGATGRIGRLTVGALERRGHETVGISRTLGVDVHAGDGLVMALTGVDAVVDACSCTATDRDAVYLGEAAFDRQQRQQLKPRATFSSGLDLVIAVWQEVSQAPVVSK